MTVVKLGTKAQKARKVNAGKRVTKEIVAKLAKMEEMASVAKGVLQAFKEKRATKESAARKAMKVSGFT